MHHNQESEKFCGNCGHQFGEKDTACTRCGNQREAFLAIASAQTMEIITCSSCQTMVSKNDHFCPFCGVNLSDDTLYPTQVFTRPAITDTIPALDRNPYVDWGGDFPAYSDLRGDKIWESKPIVSENMGKAQARVKPPQFIIPFRINPIDKNFVLEFESTLKEINLVVNDVYFFFNQFALKIYRLSKSASVYVPADEPMELQNTVTFALIMKIEDDYTLVKIFVDHTLVLDWRLIEDSYRVRRRDLSLTKEDLGYDIVPPKLRFTKPYTFLVGVSNENSPIPFKNTKLWLENE